jgi:phosphoglycolate phosphatase-like HAD superfamily hydrolase
VASRWVAFDLDGTLIDARHRQVEVTAWLLSEHGAQALDPVRFWRLKRAGAPTSVALQRLGYDAAVVGAVAAAWPGHMESDPWLAQDRALPGVKRVLQRLRADGREIAVLTARRRAAGAPRSLAAAGLTACVDDVWVVEPEQARSAKAQRLRALCPAWFIGDTDSDGAAARTAEVPFRAVSTGQRSPGYLRGHGYEPLRSLHAAVSMLCPQAPTKAG